MIGTIEQSETTAVMDFVVGDILDSTAEALVNTVNCVGIMGRGIALQFKNRFPENFKEYEAACKRSEVVPGRMFVHQMHVIGGPKYIINFPTKRHWRGKSRIEDIESGLESLKQEIIRNEIRSVAIPPLGAGLGGLDWMEVRRRIVAALRDLDAVKITVFEPGVHVEELSAVASSIAPEMNGSRAALITLMQRYLAGLLDPSISLLEVHKLVYFMQAAGQSLQLNFVKGVYGPYAKNLRHVLRQIEGHFITGYADGGDAPTKELHLVPGAAEDAKKNLKGEPATRERIERVAELVDGFETPFGLELLATVHWVANSLASPQAESVIAETWSWNERKRKFSERQIRLALRVLESKHWLGAAKA